MAPKFWRCVETGEPPSLFGLEPPKARIEAVRIVDMSSSNAWAEFSAIYARTVAFDNGKRLANVVDSGDARPTKRYRSRAHGLPRPLTLAHIPKATTQRFIDQSFQADSTAAPQSFERGSYIIVERQRGSHHHQTI